MPEAVIISAAADETTTVTFGPRNIGSAAPQARAERGGARAVGEHRQANQSAPEKGAFGKSAGGPARGKAARCPCEIIGSSAKPTRTETCCDPAAGAARTAGPLAAFARQPRDRCKTG